ncbi:1747_t:CDS:2 [Paraglomus occultum]|uniref:1747_t:CDS:1 n=1 Tax=Paraglomus occultum TaxID=144539 RepID=A0A9N9AJG5_9GLOM|nr:1747_t:CDS:2 [Paraglomus occultum]
MSKIANRIISIPERVKINLEGGIISAEGPLGKSEDLIIPSNLEITNQENKLSTKSVNSALAGTYNSLISNLIKGVVEGHESVVEVKGVGYKVSLKEGKLEFSLGKSHLNHVAIPSELEVKVEAIDDTVGNTLTSASTKDFSEDNYSRKNKDYAKKLGELFAEKLKKENKEKIIFDRNGRPYHGKMEEEKKSSEVNGKEKVEEKNNLVSSEPKKEEREDRRAFRSHIKSETLANKRVVKVTKGGRRFSFTCLVLIKDEEKKAVAFAHAGGKEVIIAFRKALRQGQKKLISYFPTPVRTIPRDITVKYKATKLFLKPTPPGSGIKASGALSRLFKFLEIKDKKKIVGRGIGSGRGKTSGRGQKGQGSRKSGNVRPGFEGGQTPVYRAFPKRGGGFKAKKISYQVVNLEELEKDEKITAGQVVDLSQKKFPVKILGEGNFTKNLTIKAAAFSRPAQEKITQVGGNFQVVEKKKK